MAFDLDKTLGFFEVVNTLAPLWSVEFISNSEQVRGNTPIKISYPLQHMLERAQQEFADYLLEDPATLSTVLRSDLDAMILPLIEAKRARKLKTVIIYSNTGVTYSTHLAKYLIEKKYGAPGLFSLLADHWHPLRKHDMVDQRDRGPYVEPYKTMETLQRLFKKATHTKKATPFRNILFVDDRLPKHRLEEAEPEGLTYLVPKRYEPKVTLQDKQYIRFLAFKAMSESGLLGHHAYLSSPFCNRDIVYDYTKRHPIHSFQELISYVSANMADVQCSTTKWTPDTAPITSTIRTFLHQVKA